MLAATLSLAASRIASAETLCDPSFSDCRTPLLALIDKEQIGIDAGFWFMEDQRYVTHLINRWKAGVPVRLLIDPRANPTYPLNKTSLDTLQAAGIPMVKKTGGGIMHFKMMLFAGQNVVEFGSANYSANALVPVTPYTNYVSETIFFEDDPAIVNSFKTEFDKLWADTVNYSVYANVTSRAHVYPTFTISADLNFPPGQDFGARSVARYNAETRKIDAVMYRVTDRRNTDALIAAKQRGVPVRYMGETNEYRLASRLWVAWNMDRLYAAGIPMRVRAAAGENHEKLVLLYGQGLSIFGSSNWTSPSANSQQEHNYFTKKLWMFNWFVDQFERKWNNATGNVETKPFVPLPPDKPVYQSIANGAVGVATTGQALVWYGGPWAHLYDVYLSTEPTAGTLVAADQPLGPSETTAEVQRFALPALTPGTTYYWKIVSKTAALLPKAGPIWSFTTAGTVPPPPPPPAGATTIVMWTARIHPASLHGNWAIVADPTAAGGSALANADHGAAKIAPALASPANYAEATFTAVGGAAYHIWIRLRAQNNSMGNDSVHLQFNDSVTSSGAATMRIGTTSSAEFVQQGGPSDASIHGWGWTDNGWGAAGVPVYFATTGTHTVRIQQREDGAIVDQIVLSPTTYVNVAPGPRDDATQILGATEP
ncbi:MAG TPA: phospholipase D-like domain-containing protein [Vicinamibacterales bacterium]|nr:phospholipase D-like domain-containing protein [Vicinamibacterales bacterium]